MVPVSITVARAGRKIEGYHVQMANDRFLAPFLMQVAVFTHSESTERHMEAATYGVRGEIHFQGSAPPLKMNSMHAGDANTAMQVSLSAAIPLAYVLQSGFSSLKVKKVDLEIDSFDEKKQWQIDQVIASPHEVRPGGKVRISAVLVGENGAEITRTLDYDVPIGASQGPLCFTVSDGNVANLSEVRQILNATPHTAEQLVATVNKLRANTKAYVRVWRPDSNFQLERENFPDPPPSPALSFGTSPAAVL